tara:strand:- start:215963 stop:216367 length:405 start_codon:yes stop_codon:yes gene_type:complete
MTMDDVLILSDKADVQPFYWVTEDDAGLDYCLSCARRVVAALHECGQGEAMVDGGSWANSEGDGARFCYRCGVMLRYSLSREGLDQERHYFEENGVDIPLTPAVAYELIQVEDAMQDYGQTWEKSAMPAASQKP